MSLLGIVWILATPLAANSLIAILEPAPDPGTTCEDADVFVILSGGLSRSPNRESDILLLHEASLRRSIASAVWLQQHPSVPAYVVGGYGRRVTEAEAMSQLIRSLGTMNQLTIIDEPRNTRESAAVLAALPNFGNQSVAVMTSAYHMPRTKAEFQRAGITLCALPTDYRRVRVGGLSSLIPNMGALSKSALSLHEFLGIAYAWIT